MISPQDAKLIYLNKSRNYNTLLGSLDSSHSRETFQNYSLNRDFFCKLSTSLSPLKDEQRRAGNIGQAALLSDALENNRGTRTSAQTVLS